MVEDSRKTSPAKNEMIDRTRSRGSDCKALVRVPRRTEILPA